VRVLLDECVDWRLGRELASHEVKTARQMGWLTGIGCPLHKAGKARDFISSCRRGIKPSGAGVRAGQRIREMFITKCFASDPVGGAPVMPAVYFHG
jgi:hypothetical protein